MMMSYEKSYKIQVLRGLAIIAVVFIHSTPDGLWQIWIRPFFNFAVGMFLALSGMLSDAERWNPWKRIWKVIVPYTIWTMIYVVIHNYRTPMQIPVIYLEQLITGKAAAVMYYIFVYCEFTLLIPVIDKLARSKYRLLGFVVSPVEIVIMRLIPLIMGYELNKYMRDIMNVSCLVWFTYFYLGYLLGNDLLRIKLSTQSLLGLGGGVDYFTDIGGILVLFNG